jgi:Mg2+ and Co2+ transporter CorA
MDMKNIKRYTDHLRESADTPSSIKERLDNLWVVYFQEKDEWHFVAAYDDIADASARYVEELKDLHGDAIEDVMQQQMDQDPDEWGEGWTPSELYHRDPHAYQELWLWCLEFVHNHQEGEGRDYYYARLKHVESDMESAGREDNLKRFMKDLAESDETPDWAKDAIRKLHRSRGAFGRF